MIPSSLSFFLSFHPSILPSIPPFRRRGAGVGVGGGGVLLLSGGLAHSRLLIISATPLGNFIIFSSEKVTVGS